MRRWIGVLLSGALLLTACSSGSAPATTPAPASTAPPAPAAPPPPKELKSFNIAVSVTSLVFAPIQVAVNQGFFASEGIKPEFIELSGGGEVLTALQAGNVDVAAGGGTSLVLAASKGMNNLVCVANLVGRDTIEVGLRKEVAEKVGLKPGMPLQDRLKLLRGLTIGVTSPGSASDQFMRSTLKSVGLDPEKDVKVVAVGTLAALQAAIIQGQVDTTAGSPPTVQQLESIGAGVLFFRGAEIPGEEDIVHDGLFVNRQVIQRDPEFVQRLVNAIHKANLFIKSNTAEAVKGLQQNQLAKTAPALVESGVKSLIPAFTVLMTEKTWENTLQIAVESGSLKDTRPDLKTIWTDQFIKKLGGV